MSYERELQVALDAAKSAGKYLLIHRKEKTEKFFKEGIYNYATKQDLDSEKIIMEKISVAFPEDKILSEETASNVSDFSGRTWIVDPIDGTRNFANGLDYYSISIAFWDEREAKVGVVYGPSYNDELSWAVKGEGAFLNGEKLNMINSNQSLAEAIVVTGFSYFKDEAKIAEVLARLQKVLANSTDVLRMGSAALDFVRVAKGGVGVYFEEGLKLWDIAAGVLILEEAGGVVTALKGGEVFDGENVRDINVLACKNERLQEEILDLL